MEPHMFDNYIHKCLCMQYMRVSSVYNFYFNGLMEPHMIEDELFSLVFVIWINHVGFIIRV